MELQENQAILRFQDYCEVYAGRQWANPNVQEFARMVDSNEFTVSQLKYFCRKRGLEGHVYGLLRKYKRYNRTYGVAHGETGDGGGRDAAAPETEEGVEEDWSEGDEEE